MPLCWVDLTSALLFSGGPLPSALVEQKSQHHAVVYALEHPIVLEQIRRGNEHRDGTQSAARRAIRINENETLSPRGEQHLPR